MPLLVPDRLFQEQLPDKVNYLSDQQFSLENAFAELISSNQQTFDTAETNLLTNGGFESSTATQIPTGWTWITNNNPWMATTGNIPTGTSNYGLQAVTTPVKTGSRSLQFHNMDASYTGWPRYSVLGEAFAVTPGNSYGLSFWYGYYSNSTSLAAGIAWQDSAGNYMGTSTLASVSTAAGGSSSLNAQFTTTTTHAIAPPGAVTGRPHFALQIAAINNTYGVTLDDILVVETTGFINWGYNTTGFPVRTTAVAARRSGAGALEIRSLGAVPSGSNFGVITANPVQTPSAVPSYYGGMAVVPGNEYRAAAYVKAAAAGVRTARVSIHWYNSTGGLLYYSKADEVTLSTTAHTLTEVTADAPAGAVWARLGVQVIDVAAINESFYIDDVSFTISSGWEPLANTSLAHSTTQSYKGAGSLEVTATTAGTIGVRNVEGPTTMEAMSPVVAGRNYVASVAAKAATVPRVVTVGIRWHNSSGAFISQSNGVAKNDSTSEWTVIATGAHTAPAGATYGTVVVSVAAAGLNEVHYLDSGFLSQVVYEVPATGVDYAILKQMEVASSDGAAMTLYVVPVDGQPDGQRLWVNGLTISASGPPVIFDLAKVLKPGDVIVGSATVTDVVSLYGSGILAMST